MVAASAKMTPARINPWPPEPENRISYRPLISLPPRLFLFLQALDHREVGIGKLRSLSLVENPPWETCRRPFREGAFRRPKREAPYPSSIEACPWGSGTCSGARGSWDRR